MRVLCRTFPLLKQWVKGFLAHLFSSTFAIFASRKNRCILAVEATVAFKSFTFAFPATSISAVVNIAVLNFASFKISLTYTAVVVFPFVPGIAITRRCLAGLPYRVLTTRTRPLRYDDSNSFNAPDGKPVDILFVIFAPVEGGGDHLRALSHIARMLRDADLCESLRRATTRDTLYQLLVDHG